MATNFSISGTIFLSRGRYYWRGILPGESKRTAVPLKPAGAKHATKDLAVAREVAKNLLEKHIYDVQKSERPKTVRTISDLVRAYLAYAKGFYKSNEPENIGYALVVLIDNCPALPPDDFGSLKLKELRGLMISDKKWCRGVVNKRVSMIVRMFKWAASEQLISVQTYQSLATIEGLRKGRSEARESKKVLPVSDAHVHATMSRLPQTVADMVRVQLLTGMRSSEVCLLKPDYIDRTGEIWIYRPDKYKGEHLENYERFVPLGPKAQAILGKYLFREPHSFCFTPTQAEVERGRERENLRPRYDKNSYRLAIQRAIQAVNRGIRNQCQSEFGDDWEKEYKKRQMPAWTPHQLRHSHGTMIRKEEGIESARAALGHKRLQTTEIYAEQDMQRAIEAARKYG